MFLDDKIKYSEWYKAFTNDDDKKVIIPYFFVKNNKKKSVKEINNSSLICSIDNVINNNSNENEVNDLNITINFLALPIELQCFCFYLSFEDYTFKYENKKIVDLDNFEKGKSNNLKQFTFNDKNIVSIKLIEHCNINQLKEYLEIVDRFKQGQSDFYEISLCSKYHYNFSDVLDPRIIANCNDYFIKRDNQEQKKR